MADNKKIDEGEHAGPPTVQSTTTATPAEADKTSLPNAMDAKPEDPPVRAAKPDTPIAQTLAAGAGEHTPPDPAEFDKAGRPREVTGISQKDEERTTLKLPADATPAAPASATRAPAGQKPKG